MAWIKQGRIFNLEPSPNRSTHAQVPTPYIMDDRIRVFYSCRNNGKAFVAYFDLAKDLKTILKVYEQPVFSHGKPGNFDADGVMPSCILPMGDEIWLYFIGWNELKNTARYQNEIGIAVSKDGGDTFHRLFHGPIMGRNSQDPGMVVMPMVIKDGDKFRCWYQSGTGWDLVDGQYEPTYVIKYAESENGIDWERSNTDTIRYKFPSEALSRPAVISKNGQWSMWYCRRSSKDYRGGKGSYRIGYAESHIEDYDVFTRMDDKSGISLGGAGEFDSEMQAYPCVFELDGKYIMLWNGNGFGQSGIGLATWE